MTNYTCPFIEDITMHYYAPTWGKYLVDFHRELFYKHLNKYDLYIHTEGDTVIRPTNIATYLRETNRLKEQVAAESFADYSIGFMRYEQSDEGRVIWEFQWPTTGSTRNSSSSSSLKGYYTTTPGKFHHQGMYMATSEQLTLWKDRCQFDKVHKHGGYHIEHVSGGMDLFDEEECNVTQLLPLDCINDLLVHHLPDKNHKRRPSTQWKSTIDLVKNKHELQQQQQQESSLLRGSSAATRQSQQQQKSAYHGIKLVLEDVDPDNRPITDFNMTPYIQYFSNGGKLITETN